MTDDGRTASSLAEAVMVGYRDYRRRFGEITRRAWQRFEERDWREGQEDATERILLYDVALYETLRRIRMSGPIGPDALRRARSAFREWSQGRADPEVAETFYNSVVRRLAGTVGVDESVEFVGEAVDDPVVRETDRPWTGYSLEDGFERALAQALRTLPFKAGWAELPVRVGRAADVLRAEVGPDEEWRSGVLEVLRPVFFRGKAAYVVGRLIRIHEERPVVLALVHPPEGITLDAVLPTSDEASVVFGFSRSYMHADIDAPRPVIEFLRSLMPLKRVDELYTGIGFNRHGKTELYRTLLRQLAEPGAQFERAQGAEGLVMSVFTLPALNVVFKVIRDRFGHPKKTSRERVRRSYDFIFVADRVGRLADAQQFEHLELPRERFDDRVLEDLLDTAARTVSLEDGTVVIEHLYTERRVHPLDLYLDQASPERARHATLDFGQAIKDLAAADIFPGDMLLKNFGVTRHGRVIFYDYDEVARLTDCSFRHRPRAAYPEAELAAEPSFYVGPDDVFPEEWRAFLGPPGELRPLFRREHAELFDPEWWREMQRRLRAGEVVDFFPYGAERRL